MSSIVVAQSENRVIGKANGIPWYLPADLKHFKAITTGHTVIMGKNTFESIIAQLGHLLPNRRNIIISSSFKLAPKDSEVFRSLDKLEEDLDLTSNEFFVIGGGQLYNAVLKEDLIDTIYLTQVHAVIDGDIFFPELDPNIWRVINKTSYKKDDRNEYDYDFIELRKY
jgi:dihydrofolate reductase